MRAKGTQKTGGRVKGTLNKTTKEMKELINIFVSNNIEDLQEDFEKLDPIKRFEVLDRMLKYILPSRSEIKKEGENQNKSILNIVFDGKDAKQIE